MNPITGLLTALGGLTVVYIGGWTKAFMAARRAPAGPDAPATDTRFPTPFQMGLGAVTNFFDALGIGSFATTTAIFRLRRMVPDRVIPGTLNAGHTLPTISQAFIYTAVIPVDVLTLFSMTKIWMGAFWSPSPAAAPPSSRPLPRLSLLPVASLAALTLAIGLWPAPLLTLANKAAAQLLSPAEYRSAVLGARP